MKYTPVLNATRRKIKPKIEILPPLTLYRQILRAHRQHLPPTQRVLGDQYVKSEFHLHKKIDNPVQIVAFLSSWQNYLQTIQGDQWRHARLDMKQLSQMSDDQLIQLYELMQAAKNEESEYSDALANAKNTAQAELAGKSQAEVDTNHGAKLLAERGV